MRLSRLGTDGSLPPDYQGFRAASELGRSILAAGQPSSCRPTTDRGCKAAIQGAALTAESGGATRAALLAMRAHRGTGSSNPLPSSGESANLGSSAAHGASWGCAYSAFCVFDWMPLSMSALGGMSAPYS